MITDEMIAEAAAKYNDALVQYWQNVEIDEHEFSSKFERKMHRLIWKVKYPYVHKALKSAACILIAFLISFASVMTFNVEARAAFTRWIREVYEDSIVYEFFGEKSETASLDYRITWVPEGYELISESINPNEYIAIYKNLESGKGTFIFNCYYLKDKDKINFAVNEEEYIRYEVNIRGVRAEVYESIGTDESHNLIWFDSDIGFNINAKINVNDMFKIAKSVKIINSCV